MAKIYSITVRGYGCKCDITESLHQVINKMNEQDDLKNFVWDDRILEAEIKEVPAIQPSDDNSGEITEVIIPV